MMRALVSGTLAAYKAMFKRHVLRLEARPPLTEDEIWERFYSDSGLRRPDVFVLWHEIARWLKVPSDRILPDDLLLDDLSPRGFSPLDTVEFENLNEVAVERFDAQGQAPESAPALVTVDDYVRAFACPAGSDQALFRPDG